MKGLRASPTCAASPGFPTRAGVARGGVGSRCIKAERPHRSQNLKAVWSEATKLKLFLHVIHYSVQIVLFQKDIWQTDTVFFVKTLGGGFGGRQVNAHFFMQEGNKFVGLNACDKGTAGILFEHDLIVDRLAVNFHEIQCAGGHARSSSA